MKKRENRKQNREASCPSRRMELLRGISSFLLMMAFGVLLLLRPDFGTRTVASVLGWVLIVGGGICIALSLLNRDVLGWHELLLGIAMAAVGIFIVIKPNVLVAAFGIILGVYTGIHGVISLFEGFKLRKLGYGGQVSLVLGGVMLALGIALAAVPMGFSLLLVRIFGGAMILCGGVNLFNRTVTSRAMCQPKVSKEEEKDQ